MNIELLDATLAKIKADQAHWNQEMWATMTPCGTAFCFAGHAVHIVYPEARPDFGTSVAACECFAGGRWSHYETLAMRVLGIGIDDASELFDANNRLEDLELIVAELKARPR